MENPYGVFITVDLAREMGIIPRDLETDLTWEKGEELYGRFENSSYNDSEKSEYDCIHEFLKDTVPTATEVEAIEIRIEKMFEDKSIGYINEFDRQLTERLAKVAMYN